jgi:hypothetical protein
MIPYTLIVASASRPHLLKVTLATLFACIDQDPVQVLIHDDAAFPDKQEAIAEAVAFAVPKEIPVVIGYDNPPIQHGPALKWLLDRVETDYVLYSQDDHRVLRPLPIRQALAILDTHRLNQIRFNKRDTLDKKGREGEEFFKVEYHYGVTRHPELGTFEVTLCAADHWYFQTGLWRVAPIQPVVNWWMSPDGLRVGAFTEHCEYKINDVFNGKYGNFLPAIVPYCEPAQWNIPLIRATVHKTYIWGRVGEPAYVGHIGGDPQDWAYTRANRDPVKNV